MIDKHKSCVQVQELGTVLVGKMYVRTYSEEELRKSFIYDFQKHITPNKQCEVKVYLDRGMVL